MGSFSVWHWLVVLFVVVLIVVLSRSRGTDGAPMGARAHPVFSSVTTQGQEAEHIDERLPRRLVWTVIALVSFVGLAVLTWVTSQR